MAGLADLPVELMLAGSGPLEADLRDQAARRLGDRARWLGVRPISEIPELMALADCLVLPSRFDGWGAVVSEALMAGTPTICSDRCGAAGMVVASGHGGVFRAGDTAGLTDLLRRQVEAGGCTPAGRGSLARWARCLGAEAGAAYLEAILSYSATGGTRPRPPWHRLERVIGIEPTTFSLGS